MDWFWLICMLGGILAITAAAGNWDWFFAHPKVRLFVNLFGRTGARIIYAVLGGFLLVPGLANVFLDARQALFGAEAPVVVIKASYPGANARVVFDTVARPIEQRVNGVENMLHMTSQCTKGGACTLRVTFKGGMDPQFAQVLVQNRVSFAGPVLPKEVQNAGVLVQLQPAEDRDSKVVSLALVLRDEKGDEAALREFAKAVAKRLVDEGAMVKPEPIEDKIENGLSIFIDRRMCERLGVSIDEVTSVLESAGPLTDIERVKELVAVSSTGEKVLLTRIASISEVPNPASIFRIDEHPALLLRGSPPDGKTASQTGSHCVQLAEAVKAERDEAKSIKILNLTAK